MDKLIHAGPVYKCTNKVYMQLYMLGDIKLCKVKIRQ